VIGQISSALFSKAGKFWSYRQEVVKLKHGFSLAWLAALPEIGLVSFAVDRDSAGKEIKNHVGHKIRLFRVDAVACAAYDLQIVAIGD
jgi:hypothetical protein